jgi:hypothetical protein
MGTDEEKRLERSGRFIFLLLADGDRIGQMFLGLGV